MLPSLRKKQPPSFLSLRCFSLFRIVIGILLSTHILLYLRHSHVISLTGRRDSLGGDEFGTGAPSRLGQAAKLVGSLLPKTRAGDSVPKSAQSRRLFEGSVNVIPGGSNAGLTEGGAEKGHQAVNNQGEGTPSPIKTEAETMEAREAALLPDSQNDGVVTGRADDPPKKAANAAGGLLAEGEEETSRDLQREDASFRGVAEGAETDPPREDPLMRVLTPEEIQELEQIEGTLEYEIYIAEKAAAEGKRKWEWKEEPVDPELVLVKHCFGGGCGDSGASDGVDEEGSVDDENAAKQAVSGDEQVTKKQEKDGTDFVSVDERRSEEERSSEVQGNTGTEVQKDETESGLVEGRRFEEQERISGWQEKDRTDVASVDGDGKAEREFETGASSDESVEVRLESGDVRTGSDGSGAEAESSRKAGLESPVNAKPEIAGRVKSREGPLSWDDVRDPRRRRALLQRKVDAQLAPYKKGAFTFADVAAQKENIRMSTHFIIEPGNITLIKDPDELSDNWSYWFRADQVRQIFQVLSEQGRIPDHVEIVVNIEASPRLPRSEGPPDLPPVLSYCSTADHYDLIGVGYQYHRCLMKEEYRDGEMCKETWDPDAIRRDHPWGDRKGTALWRGSPTGGLYRIEDWKEKPRSRLVIMSKDHPDVLDAIFTPCSEGQCTVDGAAAIGEELGYADRLANFTDYVHHKYLVDIDGESWSSRFFQLLSSGATVFKQSTHYREFSDFFFEAGTHYMRYAKDLGDLLPLLQSAEGRQEDFRVMGERSLALVEQLVRDEVILEYLGMLLTSYTELFAEEGAANVS